MPSWFKVNSVLSCTLSRSKWVRTQKLKPTSLHYNLNSCLAEPFWDMNLLAWMSEQWSLLFQEPFLFLNSCHSCKQRKKNSLISMFEWRFCSAKKGRKGTQVPRERCFAFFTRVSFQLIHRAEQDLACAVPVTFNIVPSE